jgi:hypothetical protein
MTKLNDICGRIYEYEWKNNKKPTVIIIHPRTLYDIIKEVNELFANTMYFFVDQETKIYNVMGVKIYISVDIEEGGVIIK